MIETLHEQYKILTKEDLGFNAHDNSHVTPHLSANPYGDWAGIAAALKKALDSTNPDETFKLIEVGVAHRPFPSHMGRILHS